MAKVLPRSHSRAAAVQALYQAWVNGHDLESEALEFVRAENSDKMDKKYFALLVDGVTQHLTDLDAALRKAVDRELEEVDPVELSVLRLAVFEFMHRPDVPYRVVLNEAVELAKSFGGEKGHKYVNGVLDKVGATLREAEYQAAKAQRKR